MSSSPLRIVSVHRMQVWQGMVVSVLLAFALLGAMAAEAQTMEEALAAYDRGDYAVAFEAFSALAKQGNASAQVELGFMYFDGRGVPQDDVKAVRWWRQAAEQGNADAQARLGDMYVNGRGGAAGRC